ncbi:MAG TPA: lytic transglycosylase domain-containing protein [Sporichthya sp.]|nr:lytic transglycosylase domain-containing protein [Sporichthya sp.]
MVAVATAVSSAIFGTVSLVPGGDKGNSESVYMPSTGSNVLHGIEDGEPLPLVGPPQPYELEAPRQVGGPERLLSGRDLGAALFTTRGSRSIPPRVLAAYQAAARAMGAERPSCHMSWPLLAGIGQIESGHARNGDVDAKGTTLTPILGPALDGAGDYALIRDTDQGKMDTDTVYDRAVGPMQFLPGTWSGLGRDANGDGRADPNNVADAALATAGYLCLGGGDMLNRDGLLAAVYRYNHSWEYVSHVLAWAGVYAGSLQPTVPLEPGEPGKGGKADKAKAGKGGKGTPAQGPVAAPTTPGSTPTPTPTPSPSSAPTIEPSPTPTPTPTPEPSTEPVSIGGRVFRDADADRVDDAHDPGVAEASVRIFGTSAAGEAVDLTLPTDATGHFALRDLAPGTYSVALGALPDGLSPVGVIGPDGWHPGDDRFDAGKLGSGAALTVDFVAG